MSCRYRGPPVRGGLETATFHDRITWRTGLTSVHHERITAVRMSFSPSRVRRREES